MSMVGNILWIVLGGGIILFIQYILAGIALCVTIIGIPFGIQAFKLAFLALLPFGKSVEGVPSTSGLLSLVMNIIWLVVGGIPLVLTHAVFMLLTGITIIGLPFAKQHYKLLGLALMPFGREIR